MKHTLTSSLLLALAATAPTATAQNPDKGTGGYLYCHMSGDGEWTAYALSPDGVEFHDLMDGGPVFDPTVHARIEGGTRDAFITRSHDCKGYLMVTTDMCVARSKKWYNYGIDMLRSRDLINWQSVSLDFRQGPGIFCDPDSPDPYTDYSTICRVWAPQIFWDPSYIWADGTKGGYMIYYSMWNPGDGEAYDRMYYSHADRSFTRLTKPRLLLDWGYATIDADINLSEADGLYHMMIKKEGGTPGIFHATAPSLLGPWGEPDVNDYVNFEGKRKCEGVSAWRPSDGKGWNVSYIEYSSRPRRYRVCTADDDFTHFRNPRDLQGVAAPQHGSFMRLTPKEYRRLENWSRKAAKKKTKNAGIKFTKINAFHSAKCPLGLL